jgi:hypothetical protein
MAKMAMLRGVNMGVRISVEQHMTAMMKGQRPSQSKTEDLMKAKPASASIQ